MSWQLQSSRRGAQQTAFQIIAADSEENLLNEQSIIWDSGQVMSDQSIHVSYAGETLVSGQRVWWKVRVWDEHDDPTAYSNPARWEMELLNTSDWQAHWIGASLVGGEIHHYPMPIFAQGVCPGKTGGGSPAVYHRPGAI